LTKKKGGGGEFNSRPLKTAGGEQNFIFIDESELYLVLMRSDKPKAKGFRMWVVTEVLPNLRKHGHYKLRPLSLKESLQAQIKLIEANEELERKNLSLSAQNKNLSSQNESLKQEAQQNAPLIYFAKAIENNQDAVLVRDFAKMLYEKERLEIGEKRLFAFLRNKGYLMNDNKPYQAFIQNGLFRLSEISIQTIKGTRLVTTTKITGKGQIAITKALLKEYQRSIKCKN